MVFLHSRAIFLLLSLAIPLPTVPCLTPQASLYINGSLTASHGVRIVEAADFIIDVRMGGRVCSGGTLGHLLTSLSFSLAVVTFFALVPARLLVVARLLEGVAVDRGRDLFD